MYQHYKTPWERKEELKERARAHTEEMSEKFAAEISECIANSKIYGGPDLKPKRSKELFTPTVRLKNTDSVSALKESGSKNKAVLNFASYKNPGGRFYDGSSAQEEMLCHSSFLYNILKEFSKYYEWNNDHKNKALYTDRAIFTPDVLFGETPCCVITCAAPNVGVGRRYGTVTEEENLKTLESRIEFIRDIAEDNNIDTLILGAFGCGVFKQDPEDVCKVIKKVFENTGIYNIILAVPGLNRNYQTFERHFR